MGFLKRLLILFAACAVTMLRWLDPLKSASCI